ncbi:MAG: phosphatase PAP2 family protein [Candidatus Cloacimonetes bacterium]|nr:phosphatase PAP2 family protein [Candidatus Cloacimonadota bacterium]MDY0228844.1 phosphatase PAP2 family protein [Candidatus Cloacimonadaceae bacterium]
MTKTSKSLLSAIDIITLIFCGWILLYMSIGLSLGRAKDAQMHLPIFLSIACGILLLAWLHRDLDAGKHPRLDKAISLIRALYPITLFGYFFTSGYSVNQIIFTRWLDPFFMNIDLKLFGYLPSLIWGKTYAGYLSSEVFHLAYFCYYPMIIGLPVYLYFKKPKAFKELIFNLCFVFYLCYFIFSILPVIGGRFLQEAMELTQTYRGGPFTHIMVFIYRNTHHLGGAFPSSHVAVALVLTVAALRHAPRLGYLFVVIAFFLTFSTVYCHYHWFIDAMFGILAGVGGYYLANYSHRKLQGVLLDEI